MKIQVAVLCVVTPCSDVVRILTFVRTVTLKVEVARSSETLVFCHISTGAGIAQRYIALGYGLAESVFGSR
jgi:hypothetical protein